MPGGSRRQAALVTALTVAVCGALPIVALYSIFTAIGSAAQTPDFGHAYYGAAKHILAGESIYPTGVFDPRHDYVYPPLTAILTIPFTVVSPGVAEVVFAALLALAVVGTLALVGVRDWRCYGLALAWPPVIADLQAGNVSILLGLAAALVWRYRDRAVVSGASLGVSLATKLFLWPLWVWLAATRRLKAVAWSLVFAVAVLVLTWGAIGFRGLVDYPGLVRRVTDITAGESYTVNALALHLGLGPSLSRALWLGLAVVLLLASAVVGRRGDERRSFVLAVAAVIACSPIVWLHYFVLLAVAVAVVEPTLGPAWFVPLAMYIPPAVGGDDTFHWGFTLLTAAITIVVAMRPPRAPSLAGGLAAESPAFRRT